MSERGLFSRGLSPRFIEDLTEKHLAPLLAAAREQHLDVHVRENYISMYYRGGSALMLSERQQGPYRSEIHLKYLGNLDFPQGKLNSRGYLVHDVDSVFVAAFTTQLPRILTNIEACCRRERTAEQELIRSSLLPTSPLVFIDRQVMRHGQRGQSSHSGPSDLIALACDESPRLLLTEVKQGRNKTILDLASQLTDYRTHMLGPDGYLRDDYAQAYALVVEQRRQLGLDPPETAFPPPPVEVEGLIALCDYPAGCDYWPRVRDALAQLPFPIRMFESVRPDYPIPPLADWETVR